LGPYMVTDWYYRTAYQIDSLTQQALQNRGPGPGGDNILINGTNKNKNGGGKYNAVTIKKGKKYRLRLINISVDNNIRVSLDNHPMQVMTSDFIPIKPYTTEWVLLAIGQRYDVVINANQTAGNYWFRANVATDCLSANKNNALSIWTYDTVTANTPTSSKFTEPTVCTEPTNLAPYWKQAVPPGPFVGQELDVNLTKAKVEPNGDTMVVWAIDTASINVKWEMPTLKYLMDGNTKYPAELNVFPTTSEGKWNYWLIQTVQGTAPVPHPMHLHGHDYFVIGQGRGVYDASTAVLNWDTPPRRDTATLPGGGWMAIAFPSNNPGAWL
jgi:FtsP/CotA-like multicopper oxidase with cupredoxin domain